MENLFSSSIFFYQSSHQFFTFFFFYLCALFLSICTYSYFWELIRICENRFFTVRICENIFHLWKSNFLNLCENKQAYKHHHLTCIFYHQNMIMIFCWVHMFQFYNSKFEFFSFCVWLLFYKIKCLCIHQTQLQYLLLLLI